MFVILVFIQFGFFLIGLIGLLTFSGCLNIIVFNEHKFFNSTAVCEGHMGGDHCMLTCDDRFIAPPEDWICSRDSGLFEGNELECTPLRGNLGLTH